MQDNAPQTFTAFNGTAKLAHGPLHIVALAVKRAGEHGVLVFDDQTGKPLDLDTRGSDAEVTERYAPPPAPPRGRGRPKLGVVPREVTLLPRHWDYLNAQPGGASNALRKLVDDARRAAQKNDARAQRHAHEAAYQFMHAIAGDFPGYEEATRALFANDRDRFRAHTAHWPHDVRAHAESLGFTRRAEDE